MRRISHFYDGGNDNFCYVNGLILFAFLSCYTGISSSFQLCISDFCAHVLLFHKHLHKHGRKTSGETGGQSFERMLMHERVFNRE